MTKLFFAAPLAALLLSGCASGAFVKTVTRPTETGPVPRAATVPTAPFDPNYRSILRDGFSWNKSELTVYVETTNAAQKAGVLAGAALWATYPGSSFKFREVSSPEGADITVVFLPPTDSLFSDGSAGSTTVYPEHDSYDLVRAKMEIRNDVDGANLVTLSAHEFGHALGIDGHSASASDCMNEYAPNPGRITQPDANTVALIYDTNSRARAAKASTRKTDQLGTPRTITCGH